MTNKVFTIVRKDGKINATVEAKTSIIEKFQEMNIMQGFREFLNERQEIKKVNLNFKEVKSSMSNYKNQYLVQEIDFLF